MKIRGWQIDGFGHFHDHRESDLPDGITVFLGPNEAGKSTLLAFLRGMLFGFPTGRQNRYEPLHTRHMGGKLFLDAPQGAFILQRNGDRKEGLTLFRPDDTLGSESELAQLLGHADKGLFKSVFAFSLSELQNFDVHKEAGIKDRIFAGSLQGGRNTAREALVQLDKENAPIFKPRGREVELVKLARRLDDLQTAIQEARNRALDFERLSHQEDALRETLARLAREQAALQLRIQRQEILLLVWPKWLERAALAQELERVEVVPHVPPQAESRLAECMSTLKGLDASLAELHLEQRDLSQRLSNLQLDPQLEPLGARISSLAADATRFYDWLQALAENAEQRLQAQNELEAMLATLGPSWSRERLEAFDASIPALDEVSRWEGRLDAAEAALAEASREVKAAQQQWEMASASLGAQRLRLAQLGAVEASERVAEQEERLMRLRAMTAMHREGVSELRQLDDKIRLLEIELTRLPSGEPIPLPRALRLGLWGIAALLLALGVYKGLTQDAITAAALLAAAVLLAGLSRFKTRTSGNEKAARALLADQLQTTRVRHAELTHQLDSTLATLHEDGRAAGLGESPTPVAFEALAQAIEAAKARWRQQEELGHELNRLVAEESERAAAFERAQEALKASEADRKRVIEAWQRWRQEAGIDEDRTPKAVALLFQALGSARQFLATVSTLEASGEALSQKADDFRAKAQRLLTDAGEALPAGDMALVQALARLQERLATDRMVRDQRDALSREQQSLALKFEAKRTEREKAETALAELFAEAGAADEASYHQRLASHAERQRLLRAMQDLDRQLDEQLGRDAQAEALREALQGEDVDAWRQALAEAQIAQQSLLAERDDVNQTLGQLLKTREEIAQASDVIAREHDYQALHDEFQRQTRTWLVRALAEDMIQETLKEVERTRQPAVLSHASRWFGEVTEGRYQRLVQHAGDFQVIDTHESRLEVEKLSQGTAEQLYLCLRLGLIQEFARQSANLPLIMDDVFVNFDPERARRVAELLVAFSSEHQVLLFTCHPETARLLQEVQPDVRLVTMPRYGGHETAPLERRAIVSQG